MKKVLVALVLILVASTVSAAEVSVGAWGRGFFVPYYSDGASDAKMLDAVSWGTAPRVGMTIAGNSDNVGFQVDFNGDNGSINPGDQQKIWVKPMDMLTVSIGRAYDDTLRGNGTFGSFDWLRISWTGEDFTFARVSTHDSGVGNGGQGAIFALDPMKELHLVVAAKSLNGNWGANGDAAQLTAADAAKNMQVGGGYTINGIGMIRGQYIGRFQPKVDEIVAVDDDPATADVDETVEGVDGVAESDNSAVNVAFKLTAVQNLYADLGFWYATKKDDAGYAMKVPVYVNYTMGALGVHALFQATTDAADTEGKKNNWS